MSTTRYCPSCDMAGRDPYTVWRDYGGFVEGIDACEYGDLENHHTYICGEYAFSTDYDGEICKEYHKLIIAAMIKEVDNGVFDPSKWTAAWPQHILLLDQYRRKKDGAVLVG